MDQAVFLQVLLLTTISHNLMVNAKSIPQDQGVHMQHSSTTPSPSKNYNIQNSVGVSHGDTAMERSDYRTSQLYGTIHPHAYSHYYHLREPAYVITSYKVELKHPEPLATVPAAKVSGPYYLPSVYSQVSHNPTYERQGSTHTFATYPQVPLYQTLLPVNAQSRLNEPSANFYQAATHFWQQNSPTELNHTNASFKRATEGIVEKPQMAKLDRHNPYSDKAEKEPAYQRSKLLKEEVEYTSKVKQVEIVNDARTINRMTDEPVSVEHHAPQVLHSNKLADNKLVEEAATTTTFTAEKSVQETPEDFAGTTEESVVLHFETERFLIANEKLEVTTEALEAELAALTTARHAIDGNVPVTEIPVEITATAEVPMTEDGETDGPFFNEEQSIAKQFAVFEPVIDVATSAPATEAQDDSPVTDAQGIEATSVNEELTIAEQLAIFELTTEEVTVAPILEKGAVGAEGAFVKYERPNTAEFSGITASNTDATTSAAVTEDIGKAMAPKVVSELLVDAFPADELPEQHPIPEPQIESQNFMDVPVQLIFRLPGETFTKIPEATASETSSDDFIISAFTEETNTVPETTAAIGVAETTASPMGNTQSSNEVIIEKINVEQSTDAPIPQASLINQDITEKSVKKAFQQLTSTNSRTTTRRRNYSTKTSTTTTTTPVPATRLRPDYTRFRKLPARKLEGSTSVVDGEERSTEDNPVRIRHQTAASQRPRITKQPVQNQTSETYSSQTSSRDPSSIRPTRIIFPRGPSRLPNVRAAPSDFTRGVHRESTEPVEADVGGTITDSVNKVRRVSQVTTRNNRPCLLHKVKHALLSEEEHPLPPGVVLDRERSRAVLPEGFAIHYNPEAVQRP